jgi:hypothetical protein
MGILEELTGMVEAQRKKNTQYTAYEADDQFVYQGNTEFSVQDYWRFMYSQLGGQSPQIAEFLVARALGVEKAENVDYWSAYDMSYRGRRIEVKETEYIHPWNKKRVSQVRNFSIAPSSNDYWASVLKLNPEKKLARQSDVYVFCLNTNQDLQNRDPLNLEHWEFYVVPTYRIDQYTENRNNPDQKNISLSAVKRLAGSSVSFPEIRARVDEILIAVDQHLEEIFREKGGNNSDD